MSSGPRELNLDALVHLILRRRKLFLLVLILCPLAAGLAWLVLPERYESRAQLLVQDQQSVNPFLEDLLVEWTVKERLPLIQSIVRSHATLEKVLRELGQLDASARPDEVNEAVKDFQQRVDVIGLGGALVLIKVQAESPAVAHAETTALIEAFTEQILRPQKETVRASAQFLGDQIERLRNETAGIEKSVTDFKTDNVTELPDVHRVSVEEHLGIREALVKAEVRLAAAEQQVALSEEKLRHLNPVVRRLETDLVEARRELSELQHRYTESQPQLVAARARVRMLQRELDRERQKVEDVPLETIRSQLLALDGARARSEQAVASHPSNLNTSEVFQHQDLVLEAEGAKAEVDLLRKRLEASDESLRSNARNEQSLNRITRDLDVKLHLYGSLLEKYEDALVTQELSLFDEENQVWTVEEPIKPIHSLKPPLWLVLMGALIAGLVLGFLLIALFAAFDDSLRGEKELSDALGAPSLGRMPRGEGSCVGVL
jgi:uncharacterized protein involved in exopolysaccharide biosynthesis